MADNGLSEQDRLERTEGAIIIGLIIQIVGGLVMLIIYLPGKEQFCLALNFLGLMMLSISPGLIAALALLLRKDGCQSPEWDFWQSLAEKSLIFFGLGSVIGLFMAFRLNLMLGVSLLESLPIMAILIFAAWAAGNSRRQNRTL